jgi:hypothetical protein
MSHAHARVRSSKPIQQIHPTYIFFFSGARSQIGARPRRFCGPKITQQRQETNSHFLSGFRTRGLSSQAPLLYGQGQQPVDIPAVTKYELRWAGHVVRIGKARSLWECRRRVCEETRSG